MWHRNWCQLLNLKPQVWLILPQLQWTSLIVITFGQNGSDYKKQIIAFTGGLDALIGCNRTSNIDSFSHDHIPNFRFLYLTFFHPILSQPTFSYFPLLLGLLLFIVFSCSMKISFFLFRTIIFCRLFWIGHQLLLLHILQSRKPTIQWQTL
jgi:hypothetical protein